MGLGRKPFGPGGRPWQGSGGLAALTLRSAWGTQRPLGAGL